VENPNKHMFFTQDGWTALYKAVLNRSIRVVTFLLDNGANTDLPDNVRYADFIDI